MLMWRVRPLIEPIQRAWLVATAHLPRRNVIRFCRNRHLSRKQFLWFAQRSNGYKLSEQKSRPARAVIFQRTP